MKRLFCLFASVLFLICTAAAYNGNTLVYVTNSGTKYHREWCSYLRSSNVFTLEEAVTRGFTPCSRCHPPILNGTPSNDSSRQIWEEASTRGSSLRDQLRSTEIDLKKTQRDLDQAESELRRKESDLQKSEDALQTAQDQLGKMRRRIFIGIALFFCLGLPYYFHQLQTARKQAAAATLATIRKELELQQKAIQSARQQTADSLQSPQRMVLSQTTSEQDALPAPPPSYTSSGDTSYLRAAYQELYEGKSIRELTGVPPDIRFDQNDYPHSENRDIEAKFIVYVTPSGRSYHTAKCSSGRSGKPVHICQAKMHGKCPCDRCKPLRDLPQWVTEYQRITRICRKFKIETKP